MASSAAAAASRSLAAFIPATILAQSAAAVQTAALIPTLTYEEVHADVERYLASVAQQYTDVSCTHLRYDELMAEGRFKVAKLVDGGWLTKVKSRKEFFAVFATAVKRHVCSLVLKHRFTEKRTGVKPPPRRTRNDIVKGVPDRSEGYRKNVELNIDDPEAGLQVSGNVDHDKETNELIEEYCAILTMHEQMVFRQMVEPEEIALHVAHLDGCLGKPVGKISIKITNKHLAEGIGLKLEVYEEAVLSIQAKIVAYRAMNNEEQEVKARFNAAVQTLCDVFQVQIPKSRYASDMLIRRIFTMAARVNFHLVNMQVAALLEQIGAMVPKPQGSSLSCYGFLYQRGNRQCESCGVKEACAVKAASFGLEHMTPSPELIGHCMTRVPVLVPRLSQPPRLESSHAILAYLDETFSRFTDEGIFYGHKGASVSGLKRLFCLESTDPFLLRFCNPAEDLRALLVHGKGYTLPLNLAYEDAVKIINQHVEQRWQTSQVSPSAPSLSAP